MSDNSIGLRLQKLREARGLGQEEVAEACGMSRVALTRYENGTRVPQTRYAAQLAAYYNVTVNYIMGLEDQKEEHPQAQQDPSSREEAYELLQTFSDESYKAILTLLRSIAEKKG